MPDRTLPPGQEALTALPLPGGGAVPDEIMLLPAPLDDMRTVDGRGPFRVLDVEGLIARSLDPRRNGGELPIDVNHATDKLGPAGGEAPARGWITGLAARDGAVFAKVRWSEAGRAMVAAQEYRSISPVIVAPDGEVRQVLRAALTNDPALLGLATLNTSQKDAPMTDLATGLAAKLGKPAATPAAELLAAVPDPQAAVQLTALQADVTALCAELGVRDAKAALLAVQAQKTAVGQVEALTARLAAVETAAKRKAAEAWMAELLAAKRGIPTDRQEGLILLHTQDAAEAGKIAALYPALGEITHLNGTPPGAGSLATALSADAITAKAVALMAERKAAGMPVTFTEAVQAIQDGKK